MEIRVGAVEWRSEPVIEAMYFHVFQFVSNIQTPSKVNKERHRALDYLTC